MRVEYKVLRWGGMEAERLEKILNDLGAESYAIVYMNENRIVLTRLADASRQEIPHESGG